MSENTQVTGDERHPSPLSAASSAAFQLKGEPEIHAIAGDESNRLIALGNAKRFTPGTRTQIWLQNQTIKALPYMPWKSHILNLATKGVRETASAITLK